MNDQEKAAFKAEIINELREAGMLKEPTKANPLKVPYEKWFSNSGEKKIYPLFEGGKKWKVWESIRILTCQIVGADRVTNISADGEAAEICEKLCQFVYDLRKEYIGNGTDGKD